MERNDRHKVHELDPVTFFIVTELMREERIESGTEEKAISFEEFAKQVA
ncbi:MAG TPA: hypothetical protein VN577_05535 [Terriglobales bacterium]|nr:hypothetical protein [Terriglobales bacterium]